jgi:hypothetical protein
LNDEIQARQLEDTNLNNLIGDVEDKFDALVATLQQTDAGLQNSITALDLRVVTLEQGADLEAAVEQLQQEIATKASSADLTALTTRVITLENDHVTVMDFNDLSDAVDLKANSVDLNNEITNRQSADTLLDARLDTLEADQNTVGSLLNAIKQSKDYTDVESTARQQADASLDARITTIEESVPTDANLQALADRVTVNENDISALETSLLNYTTTIDLNTLLSEKATVIALQQESNDRSSADTLLQNNINTLSGDLVDETTARTLADTNLQLLITNLSDALDSEVLNRQTEDSTLQAGINQTVLDIAEEVTAREALDLRVVSLENNTYTKTQVDNSLSLKATVVDLNAEIARAQLAEQGLQSSIDTIMTGSNVDLDTFGELINLINSIDTENSDGLAAEIAARIAADQTLQSNIDVLSNSLTTTNNNVTALDTRLDVLEGNDVGSVAKALQDAKDYSDAQLLTETTARTNADQLIQADIDQIQTDVTDLELLISNEESARVLADQTINTELATKATIASVTIINSDLTSLTSDLNLLEDRVSSAESTLAIKANQDDLNFETQARVQGDAALQLDVANLQADVALLQQDITSINTNLDNNIIDTVNQMLDNNLHSGITVSLDNDQIAITSLLRTVNDKSPVNGNVTLNTNDVLEGANQYHTQERVRTSISVQGDLEYDQENGIISFTNPWVQTDDVLEFNGYVKIQGHLVEQFDMGNLSNDVEYTLDGGSVASISHTVTDLGTLHYRRLF